MRAVGILNNRLYLDGGETRMMVGNSPNESFYETNPRLLWVDLSVPFDYSNYTVKSSNKPDTVPSLALGAGFASTRKFFRFGGYYPMNNMSARHLETSPEHTDEVGLTWSYDALSEVWAREPNAGILTGLAAGASATNPFTNEAYFLGGSQDSWTLQGSPDFYVDGMVALNMTDASWRNDTVPGPAISGGFLEYLPIGEKGALVSFGGMSFPEGVAGASGGKPVGLVLDSPFVLDFTCDDHTHNTRTVPHGSHPHIRCLVTDLALPKRHRCPQQQPLIADSGHAHLGLHSLGGGAG